MFCSQREKERLFIIPGTINKTKVIIKNRKDHKVRISREIKIGLVFFITLALFIWGLNFLQGRSFYKKQLEFFAVYDRVDGLLPSNPVNVNGLQVGKVVDLYFASDTSAKIIVKFNVADNLLIPRNSIARIYSQDLMGSKAINLKLGTSSEYCVNGDTLSASIEEGLKEEVNKQVQPLKRKAENLLLSIDSMVTVIQYVFNEELRDDLTRSIASIRRTINNLESTTYKIDTLVQTQESRLAEIIDNIESITKNLSNNNENISNILYNFSAISDTLAKAKISETLLTTNQTLRDISSVLQRIENGEGTIGMLINDDSLYNRLVGSAGELNLLLEDMKLNPGRYVRFSVFGKSDKKTPYVPPGEEPVDDKKKKKRKD